MNLKNNAIVLGGAALGGLLGYIIFFWLTRQGFYGLVIPGGLLGFGAGHFRAGSTAVAIVCGMAALALGLFCEWCYSPFRADGSFGYFLAHAHQLPTISLIMIALGSFLGFWIPFRRRL